MPVPVTCLACSAKINAPDTAAGKRIKCPKCQKPVAVPAENEEFDFEVVEEEETSKAHTPKISAKGAKRPKPADDADEDDVPKSTKKKKKKKQVESSSMTRNIIGGGVLLVLVVIAGIVFTRGEKKPAEVSQSSTPSASASPNANTSISSGTTPPKTPNKSPTDTTPPTKIDPKIPVTNPKTPTPLDPKPLITDPKTPTTVDPKTPPTDPKTPTVSPNLPSEPAPKGNTLPPLFQIDSIAITADSKKIAAIGNLAIGGFNEGSARTRTVVRIWDVAGSMTNAKQYFPTNLGNFMTGQVAVSSDETKVAAATEGNVVIWDAATGQVLHTAELPRGLLRWANFSPDNKTLYIMTVTGTFHQVNVASGQVTTKTPAPPSMLGVYLSGVDRVAEVRPTQSGLELATWDPATDASPKLLPLNGARRQFPPEGFAVSADGKVAVIYAGATTGTERGGMTYFNATTGEEMAKPKRHNNPNFINYLRLALSADGKYVTGLGLIFGGPDGTLMCVDMYRIADGKLLYTTPPQFAKQQTQLNYTFTPDGKWMFYVRDGNVVVRVETENRKAVQDGDTVETDVAAEAKAFAAIDPRIHYSRNERSLTRAYTVFGLERIGASDATIKTLSVFKHLASLDVSSSSVTDAGLKEIATFSNLTGLVIRNTKVTDSGLKELSKLKNLIALSVGGGQFTDVGVKEIAALEGLTDLSLSIPKATDASLKELGKLKNLILLDLKGTPVTEATLSELRKALPKCNISK